MKKLGIHLLIELCGCDAERINDLAYVTQTLLYAAESAGATIVGHKFHRFNPQGISGVVIITESHFTLHSWPEYKYLAIDIFTCGDKVDPWKASSYLEDAFKASCAYITDIPRGIP